MKRLTVVAVICLTLFSTPLFASKIPSPPMTDEAKATGLSEFSAYVAKLEVNPFICSGNNFPIEYFKFNLIEMDVNR